MQLPVHDIAGNQVSTVELPADIFEANINDGLMWQYYMMQRNNQRLGTAKTKRRNEINRTHAKWYRQKGTGRARHGSRNAPIFVGGAVAHGPVPHKYTHRMPKKMRHAALRSALSALARDGQLVFVDKLSWDTPKTKNAVAALKALAGDHKALVLIGERNENVELSFRNVNTAVVVHAAYINVRDLLRFDRVIVPIAALDTIKTLLGKTATEAAG